MTGDGAVVREPFKLDEAEIAKAREAADQLRRGYRPGEMSTTRLRYLGHLERQQAVEIERLNDKLIEWQKEWYGWRSRLEASKARAADLLKALESCRALFASIRSCEGSDADSLINTIFGLADEGLEVVAAAKGETV